MSKRLFACFVLLASVSIPATAQDGQGGGANIIVQSMVDAGLPRAEAQRRYDLDLKARELQARLQREEAQSFAGMYGSAEGGDFRIFVRFTGNAAQTLAKYENDPAFVAVQAAVPLHALKRRQEALQRSLEARGITAGSSIDLKAGKVKISTRQTGKAQEVVQQSGGSDDTLVIEDDASATPTVAIVGGRQATYQSTHIRTNADGTQSTILTSDRATLGFSVMSGTTSGVVTAAHFGRCRDASGNLTPGCEINGPALYNPTNATGKLTGTPSLTWRSERLGGAYDVEFRTSTTDTFAPSIDYRSPGNTTYTPMSITGTYDPYNFVVGSSRVCKMGFTTGYACGVVTEIYNQLWFGTYGDHFIVKHDTAGTAMAAGGDSGGPVFLMNTAVGLITGVFPASSTRSGQMSFMPIKHISALGLTIKTTP